MAMTTIVNFIHLHHQSLYFSEILEKAGMLGVIFIFGL
jgi:hypothetical protein